MIYFFNYLSDLQKQYPVKSFVNLINRQDQLTTITTQNEDNEYLPTILLEKSKLIPASFNLGNCYQLATLRTVRLWITSNSYVQTAIPFVPDSNNFNLFFEQTKQNSLIELIEYTGERIQAYHLRRL